VPVYTYRCEAGHEWDEVRPIEGSQISQEPCSACMEAIDAGGHDLGTQSDFSEFAGKKVPARASVSLKGPGWTPKFFPQREGK